MVNQTNFDNVTFIGKAANDGGALGKERVEDLLIQDPLQELLDEFSDLVGQVENPEKMAEMTVEQNPLHQGLNFQKEQNVQDVVMLIQQQLKILKDNQERIKFYLDEMESYLPNKDT